MHSALALSSTASGGSASATLISDTFNRADSSTPGSADTGQTWLQESSGSTFRLAISSNKCVVGASGPPCCEMISDSHVTNVTVKADITPRAFEVVGIFLRAASTGSAFQNSITAFIDNGTLRLCSLISGSYSDLGTSVAGLDTSGATTYTVAMSVDGSNNFTLKLNSVTKITGTSAAGSTNTYVGMRIINGSGLSTYDNFKLTTP